jgi:hypothetical protein
VGSPSALASSGPELGFRGRRHQLRQIDAAAALDEIHDVAGTIQPLGQRRPNRVRLADGLGKLLRFFVFRILLRFVSRVRRLSVELDELDDTDVGWKLDQPLLEPLERRRLLRFCISS